MMNLDEPQTVLGVAISDPCLFRLDLLGLVSFRGGPKAVRDRLLRE